MSSLANACAFNTAMCDHLVTTLALNDSTNLNKSLRAATRRLLEGETQACGYSPAHACIVNSPDTGKQDGEKCAGKSLRFVCCSWE